MATVRGGHILRARDLRRHRRRDSMSPISITAATTLTMPTPETAPRTNGCVSHVASTRLQCREVVAVPELRPGRQDQQQPRLEQVQGEQHATEQGND